MLREFSSYLGSMMTCSVPGRVWLGSESLKNVALSILLPFFASFSITATAFRCVKSAAIALSLLEDAIATVLKMLHLQKMSSAAVIRSSRGIFPSRLGCNATR